MNQQNSTECPQPGVLVEFLQGKLQPPQLNQCESHLKDCSLCHETLVGLSSNDTLSERVMAALQNDEAENFLNESSVETQSLLDRLTSDDFKRSSMAAGVAGQRSRTAEAEIIADRAAEILRCVTPSEDSLGKLGDYTLVRLIGAGSTGVVFQAIDETLDRTVALKVLRPSLGEISRSRFLIEAKLAASIEHVNVVTIFQIGQVDRLAFMAMPWLPGQTLESLLASSAQGEPLDDNQIVEIIRQVAAGLDAAHQQQLVHRDIKPANLWICEDDQRLKILDFGLARISDDNPSLTMTGMLAGTPNFMSPEQTRGLELDGRSDLFSLGCVLYRLLAGRLPFGSPTVLATLSSIQSHTPVPPVEIGQDINQDLSDLTMCLLEKQPINRPQSCEQLIELLTTPRDQWPMVVPSYSSANVAHGEASQPSAAKPIKASSGRGWSSWITTVVGLLLLGGFGWLVATQVIRISTPDGEVVIETSDENVEVQVLQDGKEVLVIDTETQQSFSLKSGQYSFHAKATDGGTENSFTIEPETLTMHRGDKAIVKVTVDQNEKVEVEQPTSVAAAPSTKINKRIYEGRTFAQWLQAAKFDRAAGAKVAASLGCARTAETDDEWAQFLDVAASLLVKKQKTSEDRAAVRGVLQAIDTEHLFGFVKSEIAQGRSESLPLFRQWFGTYFKYENPPPFPWEQINELTDVISQNSNKPGVLEFLQPILYSLLKIDGPEAERYLPNLQKSPAGKHIKELALTGGLQEKFDVYHLAIQIFNDKEVRESFKNDLLDPSLDNRSVMVKSVSKPWPAVKPELIAQLFRAMGAFDDNDVDMNAEAAYVSEASDLLIKVTDGFLKKELLFSDSGSKQAYWSNGFLTVVSFGFFDVVQRTSDKDLKQRLLKSFEALRASLAPEIIDNDDDMKERVQDLDYVIGFCKDFPPSRLPPNTRLYVRKPRKKAASKVEKVDPAAETPKTTTTANKRSFAGKTFTQWLDATKPDPTAGAILGCLKTVETDQEWAQLLEVTTSFKIDYDNSREYRETMNAIGEVAQAVSSDHLFDFVESEIVQGKSMSLWFFGAWFRERSKIKDPPPFPWTQINELTDLINQNADKPGGLEFLTHVLSSMRSIDGPEAKAYVTKLRNSLAGRRVREIALTGNLQRRFDVSIIALRIFDDEAVQGIYKSDLFDSKLNDRWVYSSSTSRRWTSLRASLLPIIFTAMDPEYWTWDNNVDAAAEAKYVTEAADLLAKVADDFVVKRSLFSKEADGRTSSRESTLGSSVLRRFFDVAQRTSDESIKQRMLQKLEQIRESWDPMLLQNNGRHVSDLDYVIAFYKGDPPAELPRRTALRVLKPKNKPTDKVEQVAPAAETPKTTAKKPKLFYEGKTFDQWLYIAKFEETPETQSKALRACAAIVKTKQESEQILVPLRDLARKYGSNDTSDLFYSALMRGLDSLSEDQALNFVSTEISDGTPESQFFCRLWLQGLPGSPPAAKSSSPRNGNWFAVGNRLPEIADVIAANFSKPAVGLFVSQFRNNWVEPMKNTKVGDEVKEFVMTGSLQQRFYMRSVAIRMFADDKAVLEIYEKDLLNPALNNTSIKLMVNSQSFPLESPIAVPWGAARVDLANRIFRALVSPRKTGAPLKADASAVVKRIKAAADLLAKTTDGLLADGEKRVLFNDAGGGPIEFHGPVLKPGNVPRWMLQAFYDIGRQSDDSEVKQLLLEKLEIIQKRVEESPLPGRSMVVRRDLEYLIALYKGNPPAKLPEPSLMRDRN